MQQFRRLTCSPEQSKELNTLGLVAQPVIFWHNFEDDIQESGWQVSAMPFASTDDITEHMLPAYTKAELDVMIGNRFAKPDLWSAREFNNSKAQDPETYPLFFQDKMQVFKNGAEASAAALIFLIANKHLKPAEAIDRHKKVFLP